MYLGFLSCSDVQDSGLPKHGRLAPRTSHFVPVQGTAASSFAAIAILLLKLDIIHISGRLAQLVRARH